MKSGAKVRDVNGFCKLFVLICAGIAPKKSLEVLIDLRDFKVFRT